MRFLYAMVVVSLAALVVLLWQFSPEMKRPAMSRPGPDSESKPAPSASRRFVLQDVRVFDGEKVWPRASVKLRDGVIESIDVSASVPEGYTLIEGKGQTLLPGLIDAHVHTWGEARRDALRFGVTTMLDMFSDHHALADARLMRASLEPTDQADLWSAGTLATAAGGHGTQFGMDIATLSSPDQAAAWVAARKAEGSDYIKIVREDLGAYTTTRRLPTLDDATAAALIAAAHAQGLRAVVHVSTLEHARTSLRDGADGLVHVFQDAVADEELIALARAHDAFVIPTLTVVAGISGEPSALGDDPDLAKWLTPVQQQTLKARFSPGEPKPALIAVARESVRRLQAGGVAILAGTDAPNANTAHGASIHEELDQLVRAGLSPSEALAAATALPARHFGLDDRGRIAAGLRADLVLVQGNPDQDIRATRRIVTVFKNGVPVERGVSVAVAADRWTAGLVSDFDSGGLDASVGNGWMQTADTIAGGASEARISHITAGAASSAGAMRIEGEVRAGATFPWAGVMLNPGPGIMQPVDASGLQELVLQLRGDGRDYALLLFSGEASGPPSVRPISSSGEWQEVRVRLADFAGADLGQLRAVALTAGMPAGTFWFEIDAVEIH